MYFQPCLPNILNIILTKLVYKQILRQRHIHLNRLIDRRKTYILDQIRILTDIDTEKEIYINRVRHIDRHYNKQIAR